MPTAAFTVLLLRGCSYRRHVLGARSSLLQPQQVPVDWRTLQRADRSLQRRRDTEQQRLLPGPAHNLQGARSVQDFRQGPQACDEPSALKSSCESQNIKCTRECMLCTRECQSARQRRAHKSCQVGHDRQDTASSWHALCGCQAERTRLLNEKTQPPVQPLTCSPIGSLLLPSAALFPAPRWCPAAAAATSPAQGSDVVMTGTAMGWRREWSFFSSKVHRRQLARCRREGS